MSTIKFIINNWAQIVVVIGAIGYIIKTILDFRIKKLEIKYKYLFEAKASAVQNFVERYNSFFAQVSSKTSDLVNGRISQQTFCNELFDSLDEVFDAMGKCRIFINEKKYLPYKKIYGHSSLIISKIVLIKMESESLQNASDKTLDFLADSGKKNSEYIDEIAKELML